MHEAVHHLIIQCDEMGLVLSAYYDGEEITDPQIIAQPFPMLVEPHCQVAVQALLSELAREQIAFGFELALAIDSQPRLFHFAGTAQIGGTLLLGTTARADLLRQFAKVIALEYDQSIGAPIGDRWIAAPDQDQSDRKIFNEFSRLNNELLTTQRALFQQNIKLQQLLQQKNELLGIAAHDLRNPLSAMKIYAKLLLEDQRSPLTNKQKELVTVIFDHSTYMFSLINSLLSIAKIEAGKLDLVFEEVNLCQLLERNIVLHRLLAQQKQIEIQFECEKDLPAILVDPGKIQQVVDNLLSNAVKFSYPNTTVCVCIVKEQNKDSGQDKILISVEDQGLGIPRDELDRLFQPFAKISVQPTGGEPSSRLGLAITAKIVGGHQGKIQVESQVGKGSTFQVRLPIVQHTCRESQR